MKIILLILHCTTITLAEEFVDSTKSYKLNEVVVTGQRLPVDIIHLPSSVQVVDSQMMAMSSGSTVADVLRLLPGVFLRAYGGSGGLQSVSLRGMGPDYSLILIDGIRYTTYQIGTVDLGIFPLSNVERIEIAGGGNSASYGADAIGGAVNIISKQPDKKFGGDLSSSFGSFGMSAMNLGIQFGFDNIAVRAQVTRERAKNGFDFVFDNGPSSITLQRTGADYSLKQYVVSSQFNYAAYTIKFSTRYHNADRGQPSAVTSMFQDNRARINDDDMIMMLQAEYIPSPELHASLSTSYRKYNQTYNDPSFALSAFYRNTMVNIIPQISWYVHPRHVMAVGGEVVEAAIRSNEVRNSKREQKSLFFSSQHTFFLPLELTLFPSLRYDSFSDVQGDISPKIGMNLGLANRPILRLRSSYGKNYRVPTFNDLYWIVGGNPHLLPERSLNFDAGVVSAFDFLGLWEIEMNYFSIQTKDKIVWQPAGGTLWSAKNLSAVSSSGVETRLLLRLFGNVLTFQYSYTFTKALKTSADMPNDATQNKYLIYTPKEQSCAILSTTIEQWTLSVIHSFTGFRYETQTNDPRFILSSFTTTDLTTSYTLNFNSYSVRVKGEARNIFNTKYEIITDYPTPLRNYRLSAGFIF
jgi:vitamin B12 transporter